jgi:hypothetical protein
VAKFELFWLARVVIDTRRGRLARVLSLVLVVLTSFEIWDVFEQSISSALHRIGQLISGVSNRWVTITLS